MDNPLRHIDPVYRRLIALVDVGSGQQSGQQEKVFYRAAVTVTDNFKADVWPITRQELEALRPLADIHLMRAYTHGTYRLAYQIEKPEFNHLELLTSEFFMMLRKHKVSKPHLNYVRSDSIELFIADGIADEINNFNLYKKITGIQVIKKVRVFNGSANLGIVARHGYPQPGAADPLSVLSPDSTHKNAKCCMLNVA